MTYTLTILPCLSLMLLFAACSSSGEKVSSSMMAQGALSTPTPIGTPIKPAGERQYNLPKAYTHFGLVTFEAKSVAGKEDPYRAITIKIDDIFNFDTKKWVKRPKR